VTGKHCLLLIVGVAIFGFQGFKEPDGRDIVASLLVESASADAVEISDAEIAGRLLLRF
jgi:hypothetical protein